MQTVKKLPASTNSIHTKQITYTARLPCLKQSLIFQQPFT